MSDNRKKKISFASDYMEGAHPSIIERLYDANNVKSAGYGLDVFSETAKEKIRKACNAPDADIYFLSGGTQANATVIDALLKPYQGVLSAVTGHINIHEAGAIEHDGHKILPLSHVNGKISACYIENFIQSYYNDESHEHMVMPGMVYISHPTEYGTLYSKKELEDISRVCRTNDLPLFLDGARLAYALACPENEVSLEDLAVLCDVFYIGGTKCGALFGESVVIPKKGFIPHFFTIIKLHGALLAKGMITGLQFDTLFSDDLYFKIGKNAIDQAEKIKAALTENSFEFAVPSPTNQIFVNFENDRLEKLLQYVEMTFWEKTDEDHTVMRIVTSWATTDEDVEALIDYLSKI